jgi:hypothetical protein
LRIPVAIALGCICAASAGICILAPERVDAGGAIDLPHLIPVRALAQWDANWYASIAQDGYWYRGTAEASPVAFFPGYPLVIRGLLSLGLNRYMGGVLLSLLCGLAALFFFARWEATLRSRLDLAPGTTGALVLCLYPFAFYLYGVMYSDGLFLLLAIAAFYALEKERPVLAALLGAVSTFCRPVAPAMVVGLLVRSIELRRRAGAPVRWVDLAPAAAGLGFAAYAGFLFHSFGDAFAFAHVQAAPGWDQPPGWQTWAKVYWFKTMFPRVAPLVAVRLGGHALVTLAALGLVVPTWRRLGAGYGLYCLIGIALPAISSKDFHSLGRYVISAFPIFLTVGLMLEERPRVRRAWLAASAALLLLLAFEFGGGAYVA